MNQDETPIYTCTVHIIVSASDALHGREFSAVLLVFKILILNSAQRPPQSRPHCTGPMEIPVRLYITTSPSHQSDLLCINLEVYISTCLQTYI